MEGLKKSKFSNLQNFQKKSKFSKFSKKSNFSKKNQFFSKFIFKKKMSQQPTAFYKIPISYYDLFQIRKLDDQDFSKELPKFQ